MNRPGFTTVAALSVALAIAFNTAIFSAVNALLLRSVAGVGAAERVVEVGRTDRGSGFDSFSYPDSVDLRDRVDELSELAAWRMMALSYGAVVVVSHGFWRTRLGVASWVPARKAAAVDPAEALRSE